MPVKPVMNVIVAQFLNLQFCIRKEKNGQNFGLETCGSQTNVPGTTGTIACWSNAIDDMWKLNDTPIEWDRARYRVAVAVKNKDKLPVSDYSGWNWNGENPDHWYPLNMRFSVIVVAKGGTFSGWDSYGGCPQQIQRVQELVGERVMGHGFAG